MRINEMEKIFKRARLILIALCILFVLGAAGCDAIGNLIPGSGASKELKFSSYKLRRDNGQGKPGATVDGFRATDRRVYFEVVADGDIPQGTKAKWIFTAVDTKAAKNQVVNQVEGDLDFGNSMLNVLTASLESQTDWSPGTYKADIYINDKLKFTLQYIVQ